MRLIDADALIEKIDKYLCKPCSSYYGIACSCCKVDDVNEIIMESQTVDRWIPCSERMPEEYKWVFVIAVRFDGEKRYRVAYQEGGVWDIPDAFKVTRWMPIPELPKEEE